MTALHFPKRRESRLPAVRRQILTRVLQTLEAGFWFCHDCDGICERDEGEQGQPAHCSRCGSHRIEWNQPALQVEQTQS